MPPCNIERQNRRFYLSKMSICPEIKSLIEENSGSTLSSVSSKLDYLIIGEKPTKRKVERAKQLKIKIINQDEFLKMLNNFSTTPFR